MEKPLASLFLSEIFCAFSLHGMRAFNSIPMHLSHIYHGIDKFPFEAFKRMKSKKEKRTVKNCPSNHNEFLELKCKLAKMDFIQSVKKLIEM